MRKPKGGQVVHFTRREPGTGLPVETRHVKLPDGSTGTAHAVNLSSADVPDRTYVAEIAGVEYSDFTVRIMFAQPRLGGGGLRSMVLLALTPRSVHQFVESIENMGKPTLDEICSGERIDPEKLTAFPAEEPAQTAEFFANLVASAFTGREATLDFYHASAFAISNLKTTNKLYVQPIVRVNARTALVVSLLRRLQELRAELPSVEVNS
jgi:hypothetical protein